MATVRLLVDNVESGIAFYAGLLEFNLVEQMGPAFASLSRGDLTLWLSGPQTSAARPMPDGRKPLPGGWNRIVLEVDDLAETVASLRRSGVRFLNEIISGPGGQQILAEDPSGNPIELFQPHR